MRAVRILRVTVTILALAMTAAAEHYRFRTFGPDEGLNTSVSEVLQDRTGFLWVGTGNGLFRYDGARFQRFGLEEGLPNTSIRRIRESADGILWVLTGRGLARWRHTGFEPVKTGLEENAGDWHAMDFSKDGRLYVGNDRGLLAGFIPVDGSSPRFVRAPGTPLVPVQGVYAESGNVWFGCGLQLCLLEDGKLRKFNDADGLPPERWGAMLRDRDGSLWVRGPQHLYQRLPGANKFEARDQRLPQSSNSIMTIVADRDGTILVSTDLGLARLAGGHWQIIGGAQGLESDTVTTVYRDREGSLWIGVWGAGLVRWSGDREWTNWTAADGLSSSMIWAVRREPSGAMLVGTDRGLDRMEAGSVSKIWLQSRGLGGDKVKSIAVSPDGTIWTGSLPGGVSRIDSRSGEVRVFGPASGLSDGRVIAVFLDREGRLWVSTGEGLFRSTGSGPHARFERQFPPGSTVRTMYFRFSGDREGRIWVGSMDGLFCWDRGAWTRVTTRDGLKDNAISHVIQTDDGAIWIAYRAPIGLSRLSVNGRGFEVRHVTKKDGLPSDYALFLGLDSRRRLWVGTDYGVAVQSFGKWIVYTHEDGLIWDDCAANSFLADPDGSVWIGTLRGLSHFQPGHEAQLPSAPPVAVTSVKFGERSVDVAAISTVPYRDRDFFVSYSGLTFLTEKNVRFRYRLVGLNLRWIETGLRDVRYSGLPAGVYRFEVCARNGASEWSPTPAVVSFRIFPPWWQAWWFGCLALGAVAGAITLVVRTRMKKTVWEHRRLESAVRERTEELELQKDLVERQKKEIEELLRQSQEASRLKSEFLANMSHEIRTPMNGVIGMAELALNTDLDAEQRDYITTVRDSGNALLVVINDVLDFSKIEAGKMELSEEPFCLRECVSGALRVFAWKARERAIQLTSEIDGTVPEFLVGDGDRLRQILLNLVGNAMKFTERGEISVRVATVGGAAPESPARTLRFSVRDTGIGIPRDKQVMIFEAFAQADGSTKRRQGGTGLGLAICSKLVNLMNGRIEVESAPGLGSEFSFTITLRIAAGAGDRLFPATPARADIASWSARGQPLSPLRILLAEDNHVNQKVAQRVIEKLGHSIRVVDDGRQAVEAAREEAFDLILMDVQMPVMDGLEATSSIRESERKGTEEGRPSRRVPIVAMTAHAMSGHREQCLRAGMDSYIAKPISLSNLIEAIEAAGRSNHGVHQFPDGRPT